MNKFSIHAIVFFLWLTTASMAAMDHPVILSFDGTGLLTWSTPGTNGSTVIETVSVLTDLPIWQTLAIIPVKSTVSSAIIPMTNTTGYFRLRWVLPGSSSLLISSTEIADPALRNFRLQEMGWGWVRFEWKKPGIPHLVGYRYQITKHTGKDGSNISIKPWIDIGPVSEVTVTNEPGYCYTFIIEARFSGTNTTEFLVAQ